MAFWAYMLRCVDGRYYTGHTDDLDRRIGQHQTGGHCAFTLRRRPVELVWSENFPSCIEALEAERIVGGWSRAKKEALIAGDWSMVSYMARPPRERLGFSTSLEANGGGEDRHAGRRALQDGEEKLGTPHPFVSSEVEKLKANR